MQNKKLLFERFDKTLAEAMKQRNNRTKLVETEYDLCEVPEWVVFERHVLFRAINRERAALGKAPISMSEQMRCEASAAGHVDYQRKYALYCAELVLDEFNGA